MAKLDALIKAWDEATWEFTEVFKGLEDADLWRRAHPRLLSVGELTGHACYWEAAMVVPLTSIVSPLMNPAFGYYSTHVDSPFSLDLSVEQVLADFKRVHEVTKAAVLELDPDDGDPVPGKEGWTWAAVLRYRSFHAAYHAGQAYSVRHIMGHTTTDN